LAFIAIEVMVTSRVHHAASGSARSTHTTSAALASGSAITTGSSLTARPTHAAIQGLIKIAITVVVEIVTDLLVGPIDFAGTPFFVGAVGSADATFVTAIPTVPFDTPFFWWCTDLGETFVDPSITVIVQPIAVLAHSTWAVCCHVGFKRFRATEIGPWRFAGIYRRRGRRCVRIHAAEEHHQDEGSEEHGMR